MACLPLPTAHNPHTSDTCTLASPPPAPPRSPAQTPTHSGRASDAESAAGWGSAPQALQRCHSEGLPLPPLLLLRMRTELQQARLPAVAGPFLMMGTQAGQGRRGRGGGGTESGGGRARALYGDCDSLRFFHERERVGTVRGRGSIQHHPYRGATTALLLAAIP